MANLEELRFPASGGASAYSDESPAPPEEDEDEDDEEDEDEEEEDEDEETEEQEEKTRGHLSTRYAHRSRTVI